MTVRKILISDNGHNLTKTPQNLIFPVFRSYTTQWNKLVGTDLKLYFFQKSFPPPKLFQFSMTQRGNLQDSQEIGNPLLPLLLDTDRKTV